jgi:ABC-2 type transport system ATP-binding protein
MSIAVNQLSKVYGSQKAVNGISFSVSKGEIVGFLGPNGAGKSTTMKILTGYIDADGGSATVCALPVGTNATDVKRKIGYLPEANPLYFDMYVREYLDFVAHMHGVAKPAAAIDKAITTTGLNREAHKKIGQLSKGYKQRTGLAAALLHDPEVLILDEPTSGLDPNQIVEIREVIRNLGKDKTILFSSHILQEVEAICNRIIIINKGNIVADSTPAELMTGQKVANTLQLELRQAVPVSTFSGMNVVQGPTPNHWVFTTTDPEAMKRQLLTLALEKNLDIIALQSESAASLEAVFRQLTGG